jgi:hypothetical protein
MSEWLKKQLERDRINAQIEADRRAVLGNKAPAMWAAVQAELKECIDLYCTAYGGGAAYEYVPNRIDIRKTPGVLELTYDGDNFKIAYKLKNKAGVNEGVFDVDLNDRKECYLRQGMDRYETMDDVSAFLLSPLLYG